jgi:hypothetical protein
MNNLITESERQNMPEWIAVHKNDQAYLVTITYGYGERTYCTKTHIWRFPSEAAMQRTADDLSRMRAYTSVTFARIDG